MSFFFKQGTGGQGQIEGRKKNRNRFSYRMAPLRQIYCQSYNSKQTKNWTGLKLANLGLRVNPSEN